MFSTLGLFRDIECPDALSCRLLNCLFLHKKPSQAVESATINSSVARVDNDIDASSLEERPSKRRRITTDEEDKKSLSPKILPKVTSTEPVAQIGDDRSISQKRQALHQATSETPPRVLPRYVTKEITPPPTKIKVTKGSGDPNSKPHAKPQTKPAKVIASGEAKPSEALVPRMMKSAPATFDTRKKLLDLLYEQYSRLNNEVQTSNDPSKNALLLQPQELITEALNEEQTTAKDNPVVYANVLKLRIVALRKMKLEDWKKQRLKQIAKAFPELAPTKEPTAPTTFNTGLSTKEEIRLLPELVALISKDVLAKHGYVVTAPSTLEIEEARKGVEASDGWEVCDRCKSRFQVFLGRREADGALTTGGTCSFHHGKIRRPVKNKGDTSHKEPVYGCCNEPLGKAGCTTASSHVFKVTEAKRLASIMPFKSVTTTGSTPPDRAVCFDCEMGYTTLGLELIRLTATAWPEGEELIDVLVRPMGEILDLNSRFSGVWPKDYSNAIPFTGENMRPDSKLDSSDTARCFPLVNSPAEARELLFTQLTTTTPLIGHSIENDLNSLRIIHSEVIDTVLLYPHPRGLPMRYGLKMLVKKYLNRDIQTGGDQGHDSREDARAAGDLVRLKVVELSKATKSAG